MTILVTGANDLIGSYIVRGLVQRGRSVRAFVPNAPDTDLRNLDGLDVELVRADLLDDRAVMDAAEGCQAIIHTARLASIHPRDRWRVWEVNFIGTANVLAAAHYAGVERVVYTGSVFALQSSPGLDKIDVAYVAARRAARAKADEYLSLGLPIAFVYPTCCLGPGVDSPSAPPQRQLVAFLRGRMPFYPDGSLNVVDARDAAEAHILALDCGRPGGHYIAGGHNVTFRDFLERLALAAGYRRAKLRVPGAALVAGGWLNQWISRSPVVDAGTARLARYIGPFEADQATHELGYVPRPLDDTLHDTVAWLRLKGMIR